MTRMLYSSAFLLLISLFVMSTEGFRCKERGETCRGFPKCCGDLVCQYEGNWNPIKGGKCEDCGGLGKNCVLDKQCCEGYQCDKEGRFAVNGNCREPRPAGAVCYNDRQCRKECDKKWYEADGVCIG